MQKNRLKSRLFFVEHMRDKQQCATRDTDKRGESEADECRCVRAQEQERELVHLVVRADSVLVIHERQRDALVGEIRVQQPHDYGESAAYVAREYRILASQQVIDLFLEEESQALAELSGFIAKPISMLVESLYSQEQYDVILM